MKLEKKLIHKNRTKTFKLKEVEWVFDNNLVFVFKLENKGKKRLDTFSSLNSCRILKTFFNHLFY